MGSSIVLLESETGYYIYRFYQNGSGHRNLVFISDYMKHTTEFVYEAQRVIVDFVNKWYPNVKHL